MSNPTNDQARIAVLEAEIERLKNPKRPKAASGTGALLYYFDSSHTPYILFSKRGTSHGEGYGITGGGFFAVKNAKPYPENPDFTAPQYTRVLTHKQECYRELCEEFRDPGQDEDEDDSFEQVMAKATQFKSFIPFQTFWTCAEPLTEFAVETPYDPFNAAHDCKFYSMQITEVNAWSLVNLPANYERPETVALEVTKANIDRVVSGLFHKHEAEPIRLLARELTMRSLALTSQVEID